MEQDPSFSLSSFVLVCFLITFILFISLFFFVKDWRTNNVGEAGQVLFAGDVGVFSAPAIARLDALLQLRDWIPFDFFKSLEFGI